MSTNDCKIITLLISNIFLSFRIIFGPDRFDVCAVPAVSYGLVSASLIIDQSCENCLTASSDCSFSVKLLLICPLLCVISQDFSPLISKRHSLNKCC